jgi:hypothetical protein
MHERALVFDQTQRLQTSTPTPLPEAA